MYTLPYTALFRYPRAGERGLGLGVMLDLEILVLELVSPCPPVYWGSQVVSRYEL